MEINILSWLGFYGSIWWAQGGGGGGLGVVKGTTRSSGVSNIFRSLSFPDLLVFFCMFLKVSFFFFLCAWHDPNEVNHVKWTTQPRPRFCNHRRSPLQHTRHIETAHGFLFPLFLGRCGIRPIRYETL